MISYASDLVHTVSKSVFSRILSQIFYIKPSETAAIILDTLDLVTVTDRGSI